MYQALYRKWRPMLFSDVVGQRHITDTLKKQIENNRLSHAYLFTGTRGTGKTTCAKLLAKAINCENPQQGEPCNKCSSCIGINNESVPDVSEIDAATYTGVDNIRSIRDEISYVPTEVRKRVYIIDECHMLSASSSNALLKILEEPPEHVLFILATTEHHKVLPTILSRCQSFAFKRLSADDISVQIREIAAAEEIPLEVDAANLIARMADGGMRDAISMLDQCAGSAKGSIDTAHVLNVLGLAGDIETVELAEAIARHNTSGAIEKIDTLIRDGKDPASLLGELMSFFRDLLVYKVTGSASLITGGREIDDLKKVVMPNSRLIAAVDTIKTTIQSMQRSQNHRVDVELCIIRICDVTLSEGIDGLVARVERLESGAVIQPVARAPKEETVRPVDTIRSVEAAKPVENVGTTKVSEDGFWPEVLKSIKPNMGISHYNHLTTLNTPVLDGSKLNIVVTSDFAYSLLNKQDIIGLVNREAGRILGKEIHAEVITAEKYNLGNPISSENDKLDLLIERGKKFNNLIIE